MTTLRSIADSTRFIALCYILVIEALHYMKWYLKNLVSSDVEESSNLMLNETDPVATLVLVRVATERRHLGR